MSDPQRTILHVDMDAFFASVEQRDHPEHRGKPLVVGGYERGVVAAASYEARKFGIHSAMPMSQALARCPDLIRMPSRMAIYQRDSRTVFDLFRRLTPDVEGLSVDEAFLDVSGSIKLFGSARQMAQALKKAIWEATELTCSVGIAPNKLVAKIASDYDKPDGLVEVPPEDVQTFLDPLTISVLPGLGPTAAERLAGSGIMTIKQLRAMTEHELFGILGNQALRFRRLARGQDSRSVQRQRKEKSMSAERTFAQDLTSDEALLAALAGLVDKVSARARDKELRARTIRLKIRLKNFRTLSRQCTLTPPSADMTTLYDGARELLQRWREDYPTDAVRLLGFGMTDLVSAHGQELFAPDSATVDPAADAIRHRFGDGTIMRARQLGGGEA